MIQEAVIETGTPQAGQSQSRVLASGVSDGLRIEVVEFEDKSLAITFDRHPRLGYRWNPGQVEPCVNTFLRLMRH